MIILEEIQNCPVEWKELGEVVDYEQPTKYIVSSKAYTDSNEIPVLTAGQSFILGYTNEKDGIYHASENNPVIIFDDFTTSKQWVDFQFKVKSSAMKMLTIKDEFENEVLLRYVWHYLGTITYKPDQHGRQWIGTYSKFLIPIPPLELQEKIVQILDKFTGYVTELTAELTAELTLRQKQYSYFRDYLLNFDKDSSGGANNKVYEVEWKTLGEVSSFRRGSFPQPYGNPEWYGGENSQPFVQVADVADRGYCLNTSTKQRISQLAIPKSVFVPTGTVIVTLQGTLGRVAVTQYDAYVDRTLAVFEELSSGIDKNYFAYILKWKFDIEKENARGSTLKTITKEEFSKFKIPVPSLVIQKRIVQILDNFDTVCNDLNIGLPKEIELRQKQYEYFREKLLTFVAEGVYTESRVEELDNSDLIKLLQWVFGTIKVTLGAICELERGKRLVRKQLNFDEGYPVFQNSLTPLGYFEQNNRESDTTFIICAGAAGEIGYSEIQFWAADDVFTIGISKNMRSKFIYYALLNQQNKLKMQVRKASIPRLSRSSIEKLEFVLPDTDTQNKIIEKLDKFNTLTSDISQGLPKEIELRQKQYEYYRDKLLSF